MLLRSWRTPCLELSEPPIAACRDALPFGGLSAQQPFRTVCHNKDTLRFALHPALARPGGLRVVVAPH
eukprot:1992138-Amphidinium_carterae.1